jgi:hypothetical protein
VKGLTVVQRKYLLVLVAIVLLATPHSAQVPSDPNLLSEIKEIMAIDNHAFPLNNEILLFAAVCLCYSFVNPYANSKNFECQY